MNDIEKGIVSALERLGIEYIWSHQHPSGLNKNIKCGVCSLGFVDFAVTMPHNDYYFHIECMELCDPTLEATNDN